MLSSSPSPVLYRLILGSCILSCRLRAELKSCSLVVPQPPKLRDDLTMDTLYLVKSQCLSHFPGECTIVRFHCFLTRDRVRKGRLGTRSARRKVVRLLGRMRQPCGGMMSVFGLRSEWLHTSATQIPPTWPSGVGALKEHQAVPRMIAG